MFYRHGMSRTRTFKSWDSMIQRCMNSNSPDYPRYGGSGIKICKRWRDYFGNFLFDMGERPKGTSLDRYPDTNGDYSPGNCRWATPEEQQRNKRNSRYITYKSETKLLIDWARQFDIPYDLLLRRANRGLKDDALFAPSRSKNVSRFRGL